MLDYSILNFDKKVIDSTTGTIFNGLFNTISRIKSNTVKVINLVTEVTDIVISGYCYVKPVLSDDVIVAYKLLMGDLIVTIDDEDTVTAEVAKTNDILRFSTTAMALIKTGLDSEKSYKLVPVQDASGAVAIDIEEEQTSLYCDVTFQCLNASFDSSIDVTITPDDDIEGGLGDETSVTYSIPAGTYTYTVSAVGYDDLTGTLTVTSNDLGKNKSIVFTLTPTTPQGGQE